MTDPTSRHGVRRIVLCAFLCLPVLALGAEINLTAGPEMRPGMFDELLQADAAFFKAVFDDCDIATVGGYVTADLEFFHDKGGLVFTSGPDFVKGIEAKCQRQADGIDFLSRRELVVESVKVYPINNFGAIQTGLHRFYAVSEGKPDVLTEVAQFTHVWKEVDGNWRLARILSYDHRLAK